MSLQQRAIEQAQAKGQTALLKGQNLGLQRGLLTADYNRGDAWGPISPALGRAEMGSGGGGGLFYTTCERPSTANYVSAAGILSESNK